MVGAGGFEPPAARTPSVCATRLRYAPEKKVQSSKFDGKSQPGLPNLLWKQELAAISRFQSFAVQLMV